jgi:proteasome assembly chaperone (PAC2) family protein
LGIKLFKTPELNNPIMIACWPGIANIGLLAVDTLVESLKAEEFGHIEPWDFFYPKKVVIQDGELQGLEFPSSKFFFRKAENRDIIFFVGEEQPVVGNRPYAEGAKAYQLANFVIDVAQRFGCQRIITSGAAVTTIHHTMPSKVWAVPNNPALISEIKHYQNTVLMSEVEHTGGEGAITVLNWLLLGVARKRNIDGICVMGEIPVYLQGFPILYPKASKSVIEVLTAMLSIQIDMTGIDSYAKRVEQEIDSLYEKLPPEAKAQLDEMRAVVEQKPGEPSKITEEDKKKIMDEIDKFFSGRQEGEN